MICPALLKVLIILLLSASSSVCMLLYQGNLATRWLLLWRLIVTTAALTNHLLDPIVVPSVKTLFTCLPYSATFTDEARVNTVDYCRFQACTGDVLNITDGCTGFPCSGDPRFRLLDSGINNAAVATNPFGSIDWFTVAAPISGQPCRSFMLQEGCAQNDSCS